MLPICKTRDVIIYPILLFVLILIHHTTAQDAVVGKIKGAFPGNPFDKAPVSSEPESTPTEFQLNDREDMPCILVKMDMKFVIEPKRTGNKKINIPVPISAETGGSCGHGEDSKMIISWGSFKFLWHFQKSRVSDAWYVDYIELSYNTSDRAFGNQTQDTPGLMQLVHSPDPLTLFLTPIGYAYSCNLAKDVKLYDDKKFARVTMKLSRVTIQPFASMTHRQFGDEFKCPEEAGRRDETVPLIVGGLLSLAVLGTIGGYGGYSCNLAKDVKLYDDKKFARVTMKLSRVTIQPFASMTHRQYGKEFKCPERPEQDFLNDTDTWLNGPDSPEEAGGRDATVPLIVGGLLSLAVLGTIGGYGGYRYFKIKKVQHDTMEM